MRIDGLSPLSQQALLAALLTRPGAAMPSLKLAAPVLPDPVPEQARYANAPSVETLVALQAISSPIERRRRDVAQLGDGLDRLERLRRAGAIADADTLADLAHWVATEPTPGDPALAALAQDLALRVRVELARRGWQG